MNDDQFEALDNRAKTAASSAQAEAQRRPRPTFDADRPMTLPEPAAVGHDRVPRRTAWIAAAAVVALVAGAVTFAATRPDGGKDTIAASTVFDPRPFVAGDLPDGFEPLVFKELSSDSDPELGASPMPVYGKTADQPLAAATVIDSEAFDDLELTPFEVDGLTLYRSGGEEALPGQWVILKQDDSMVLMFGATEDDAVALARIISVVDGKVSVDTEALPDGWRRLVTVDDPLTLMFKTARPASSVKGYLAAYTSEMSEDVSSDNFASIQITSLAGDEATMWAGRLFVPDSREVTVRGHRGYSGAYPNGAAVSDDPLDAIDVRTVSWLERPGEVLGVTGINVPEEQLLAVAESVRPATEEEWQELVDQSQLGGFNTGDMGPNTELGRENGTFADGTKWSVALVRMAPYEDNAAGGTQEGEVYTDLRVLVPDDNSSEQGGSSSSVAGGAVGFMSMETTHTGGRHFASAVITDEVDRVELRRIDGTVLADATIVEVAGYRIFVAELTEDPIVVVALQADGVESHRVTFANLDENMNVDMDDDGSFNGQTQTFEGQGTPIDEDGNPIIEPAQPSPTTVVSGD